MFEFKGEHSIVDSDSARQSYGVVQHVDVPERLIPPDDNDCAGLPRSLKLAVGAQVMLQRNILCEDGLVNGTRGIVVSWWDLLGLMDSRHSLKMFWSNSTILTLVVSAE